MKTHIQFYHPFELVFYDGPSNPLRKQQPSDDVRMYGFSLNLTTELYFYTYYWGYGFNFRILGFGFELARLS
jgi:hypothetical protein